jgi:hypothetical protein
MAARDTSLIPASRIERRILLLRGQKVMLDFHLAELYEVEARILNQAVKRNHERFPEDFMFQLTKEETALVMRSQIVTTSVPDSSQSVMSSDASASESMEPPIGSWPQTLTRSKKHRGLAYRPYAFTEQGVAMLSSVLRSTRAVRVNIAIMRTFVKLRQMLANHADLARKLGALERKYDAQFKVVFDAIRELMKPVTPQEARREIGFHAQMPGRPPKSGARTKHKAAE